LNGDDYKGFDPIGYASYKFTGTFDGLGHTISELMINRSTTDYVGLFGYTSAADIRNVGLEGGSVTGDDDVGGLVGINFHYSNISNSYATGSVTGDDYVGGLVGRNYDSSTVSNSYATGSVTGDDYVGGLVGYNDDYGTVSDSYATGSVTATGTVNNHVGGLVGFNFHYSTVSNSYATGSVHGTGDLVGGLVGYNYNSSNISNSYATGSVTGDDYVGGLVGYNYDTVSDSYATGSVTGNNNVGGLVGYNIVGSITNSFWDKETTEQTTSAGSSAAFGKTTEDMKKEATYENWDFTGIWWIDEGNTYPLLRSCQTPVTLTAVDSSKVYDGASYSSWSYTASSSSYNEGKVSGTADYGGLAKEAIDFGSYELTLGGLFSNQYYLITLVNGTLDITSKALTLSATAANKDYDGNTTATVAGYGLSGFIGTETVTASSTGALFDTKDAGDDKTVTIAGITLANGEYGGLASNYSVAGNTTATADITSKALTLAATAANKDYDGNTTATVAGYGLSGFIGDETVTASSTGALFDTEDAGTDKTVTIAGITLANGETGDLASNYSVANSATATADITSKALTLAATAANKDYDGNTTATVAGYGLSGFVGAETVTASSTGALFDTKDAGDDKTVTIAGITLANGEYGGLASNYSVAGNTTATADITARPVSVMADSKTKEETEIDPLLTYQAEKQNDNRGLIIGESLIGALIRVIGETSGIYEIQQGTVVDAENLNYEISYTPADLMITEKNDGVPEALRIAILNAWNLAAGAGSRYGGSTRHSATGSVAGTGGSGISGLVGYNNSSISNSYAAESGHVNGEINLPEAVRLWLNSNPD